MSIGRWAAWLARLRRGAHPAASAPRSSPEAAPAAALASEEALADLLRVIDSWRPRARFVCARHGTEAAVVKLVRRFTEDSELVVESALGRGWHRLKTCADEATFGDPVAEQLQEVLARADAAWLYFINPAWAPFFCPQCQRVYCGACWTTEDVPNPDDPAAPGLRAICPEGHVQTLYEPSR